MLSKAGIASLTLIEEIDHLAPDELAHAYQKASEWLANCQSEALLLRFKAAGTKLALELLRNKDTEDATKTLFNMPRDLDDEVLKFEHDLISQALAKVEGGQVVDAAKWLDTVIKHSRTELDPGIPICSKGGVRCADVRGSNLKSIKHSKGGPFLDVYIGATRIKKGHHF